MQFSWRTASYIRYHYPSLKAVRGNTDVFEDETSLHGNAVQLQNTSPIRPFLNTPHKTVSGKYSGFPLPGNFFAYLAKNGSAMKRFIFLCSLFTVFLVKAQDSASIPTLHHGTEFIIKVVAAEG